MTFLNRDRGWAVGYDGNSGVILRTDDGGASWEDRSSTAELPAEATERGILGLTAIRFLDESRGVIVGTGITAKNGGPDFGYLREGFVLRTEDGGASWTLLSDPPGSALIPDLLFENPSSGWLAAGQLLRTEDGGRTWTEVDDGIPPPVAALATVVLPGADLLVSSYNGVSVSADAGAPWQLFPVVNVREGVYSLEDIAVAK